MPSLVLTGHPCTGKTSFAHLLASRALRHPSNTISHVIHIRESTACPDQTKAECYSNSHREKTARAALKSEFDRAVTSKYSKDGGGGCDKGGGSTLVILDSLNYIKGYRYELYCISKAAGERHGVVWIMGDRSDGDCSTTGVSSPGDDLAKKRNRDRKELQMSQQNQATAVSKEIDLDGYYEDDATMDALILRYEPPDEKNRWENPLYKVNVTTVLPWGQDGTTLEISSDPNNPVPNLEKRHEGCGELLSSPMEALEEVKDCSKESSTSSLPKKSARKSASGFKRRSKKSMQQGSTCQSQSATAPASTKVPTNIPSSMASRNLTSRKSGDRSNGSKRKMEDIIDGILDSFLVNTAPLKEGMSTFKQVSAESNVLNQMDNLTHHINNEILKAQKATSLSAGVGGKIFIPISNDGQIRAMNLSKQLHGNQLRTFRRQFLKWIADHPMPNDTKEAAIKEGYIAYIESHI